MRRGLVTGVLVLGVSASSVLPRTTALAASQGVSRLSEASAEQARVDAPKDPVSNAEAQVAAAKRAANSAAARYAQAESRLATLSNELAQLDRSVASAQRETAKFRDLTRERAIDAYRSAGQSNSLAPSRSGASDMDAAMEAVTRRALLARVNGLDSDVASRFAALSEDLEQLRGQVASRKEEQRRALADLQTVKRQLDGRLSATVTAQRNLQARLRREASARASVRSRVDVPSQVVNTGGRAWVCPVPAGAFTNDWGQPRSGGRTHKGTDLFAGKGTPNVAVVSGSMASQSGGLGGIAVILQGDDGYSYYYAHLQSIVGGARRVSQGELIGRTGNSGNASDGPAHTHFEIRRGGVRVNPFPTLRAAC